MVYVSDKAMEILIIGAEHMNRAMQDDVVAVELLPESDWRRPGASDASEADDDEAAPTEAEMPTGLAPALDDPIEVRRLVLNPLCLSSYSSYGKVVSASCHPFEESGRRQTDGQGRGHHPPRLAPVRLAGG